MEHYLSTPAPRFFSIDAGRPFLQDLAACLYAQFGTDPLAMSAVEIYLPTRRAVRQLAEELRLIAEKNGVHAIITPQIRSLGDIDDDTPLIFSSQNEQATALPPAVSQIERRLILAQLVAMRDSAFSGQENWAAAYNLAGELSKLLDSFYTEEVGFEALEKLVPEEFAAHWGQSLVFLKIIAESWPAFLKEQRRLDPADRRARLIRAQAERWQQQPPTHPVIIAGSTGSAPSVAALMAAVSNSPQGAVILPGFDHALAADPAWGSIDAAQPHPQAGMKLLLERLNIASSQIRHWPGSGITHPRTALLSLSLRPAAATDDWRHLINALKQQDENLHAALTGLSIITANDEEEETTAIAALMRETLETPGKTALLVTPDRDLARRVSLKMLRWGVVVDDSAGAPFHNTPCGIFLRLVASYILTPNDPNALLALLQHPLSHFGLSSSDKNNAIDRLNKAMRGLRPNGDGLGAIQAKFAEYQSRTGHNASDQAIEKIFALLQDSLAGWQTVINAAETTFADMLAAHLHLAETLSTDVTDDCRLWYGEDGDTGSRLFAELLSHGQSIKPDLAAYYDFFTALLSQASVRARRGGHERLAILGPLEARLQSADHVILSGLNEGVWPSLENMDPFLSRPMRKELGLPVPEQRVALAAHDFAQLAAHPNVTLTRSMRRGKSPANPSRWLVRLENILAHAAPDNTSSDTDWAAAIHSALDQPTQLERATPPRPVPPRAARPTEFYVTQIGDLLRDPYGIYAKRILNLRKLDPIGEDFGAKHLGLLYHKIFEEYAKRINDREHALIPPEDQSLLQELFETYAPDYGYTNDLVPLWQSHTNDTLLWFAQFHRDNLAKGRPVILEDEGHTTLLIGDDEITLRARADRIDLRYNGQIFIFDYKSKSLPTLEQMKAQFSPQLPLTALIASRGGFEKLPAGAIEGFAYLRAVQRLPVEKDNIKMETGNDAALLITSAHEAFCKLIAHYLSPTTPFLSQPRPQFVNQFGDYDILARRSEWAGSEEGGVE